MTKQKYIMALDAGTTSNPVSYTHLDVYKRQVHFSPPQVACEGSPQILYARPRRLYGVRQAPKSESNGV